MNRSGITERIKPSAHTANGLQQLLTQEYSSIEMVSRSFTSLLIALVSSGLANAWFRVACTTPLVTERIDPIVSPGVIGSNHVHTSEEPFISTIPSNLTQSFDKFTDQAVRTTTISFGRDFIDRSSPKGFGANSTYEDLVSASCTSCEVQPQVSVVY